MFFRRHKPHVMSFEERLESLKSARFSVTSLGSGKARASRDGCGADLEDAGDGRVHVNKAGVVIGNEIGLLVHGGFQMFWQTPGGKFLPALSTQLKALHAFEEDLKEALGLTSLYNESLGTTCDQHVYDRVLYRDRGEPPRPWQK
jgi:hypothetical protein